MTFVNKGVKICIRRKVKWVDQFGFSFNVSVMAQGRVLQRYNKKTARQMIIYG